MTQNEIFERLLSFRNNQFVGTDDQIDEFFDLIMGDIARHLELTSEQVEILAGRAEVPEVQSEPEPEPEISLNPAEYEITNGYIGSLGATYKTATEDTIVEAIVAAAVRHNKNVEQIRQMLVDGKDVAWCDSPNHHYDHSTGYIRRKRAPQAVELVRCDCGHSVPRVQVMSASLGTSCPDCYDRMSA